MAVVVNTGMSKMNSAQEELYDIGWAEASSS